MSQLWVDNRHPDYYVERYQRQFSRDQFTGDALLESQDEAARMEDPAPAAGNPRERSKFMDISGTNGRKRISEFEMDLGAFKRVSPQANGTYLKRRSLGESADAFRERASITRFPSHMPALVETYVGGINAVDGEADRKYGDPLGDPEDPQSPFFRTWHDVDGTGRNWPAAFTRIKTDLIVSDVVWAFYELGSAEHPRMHLIDPNRIVDWYDEDGIPVWLLMHETRVVRPDMHKPAETQDVFTEYSVDGFKKWVVVDTDEGRDLQLETEEEWAYPIWSTPDRKRKRLPFTRARLSDLMGRYVGYQMAMDHNMLYNLLSDARWNFRVINHPRLRLKDGDKKQFEEAMNLIAGGANGLLGDWGFISPEAANGAEAYKVFSDEVKQFYVTNHQRMNSSAIERSATEIAYDEQAGRTSFLSILTDAIDEFENDAMFVMSQLLAPTKPDQWLNCRVKRSKSFKPIDINAIARDQSNSVAALIKYLPADTAMRIAREGVTDEIISAASTQQGDTVDGVSL